MLMIKYFQQLKIKEKLKIMMIQHSLAPNQTKRRDKLKLNLLMQKVKKKP